MTASDTIQSLKFLYSYGCVESDAISVRQRGVVPDMPSLDAVIEVRRRPIAVSAHRIPLPGNHRMRFQRLLRNSPQTGS